MEIEISFIVPVFNAEDVIERALNSLTQANSNRFEIILIDDGSTDSTCKICHSYASSYDIIKCIHTPNRGVSSARNLGISLAKGKYIAFCDADDYFTESGVNAMIEACNSNTDIILFNNYIETDSEISKYPIEIEQGIYAGTNLREVFRIAVENKINQPWGKLYRRDLINQSGVRFPGDLSLGEDLVFNLEFLAKIKSAYVCHDYVYTYVRGQSGLSAAQLSLKRFQSYDKQFTHMIQFANEIKLNEYIEIYRTILRVIVNFCGKLRLSGQSSKSISAELRKHGWYSKIVACSYPDLVDKVRALMLRNSLFLLASFVFRGK